MNLHIRASKSNVTSEMPWDNRKRLGQIVILYNNLKIAVLVVKTLANLASDELKDAP